MFYEAANVLLSRAVLKIQTLANGRRQAAKFKAGEGRLAIVRLSMVAANNVCRGMFRRSSAAVAPSRDDHRSSR